MKKLLLLAFAFTGALCAQKPFEVKVTGHGSPMILIPGLASAGETWDTTVAHYRDRYECHVLTLAGFAGLPRIPAPMLDTVRDSLADYIRKNKLEKPIIVGHSLGGFLALSLAVKYPDMPGKLVIVDSYPFLAGAMSPGATLAEMKQSIAATAQYFRSQDQDMYLRMTKSGLQTRSMVTKDSDLERLIAWGLASDRTAVADAMIELMSTDLRDDLGRIHSPALVMATWIGYKDYTTREKIESGLHQQYAKLDGARLRIADTARHFIMWDDPNWMFGQMDEFLSDRTAARK
ncbi:MAG TPA: alpha/beta hydrolase [Candidatus Sulfopaludibacter sp.]|jgi:pimeloyl-ACP methyl ester carboxylesterase|nr:alpha/beta hydrolase [Candidatus Sulfopaludibacter sp.]